MKKKLAMYWGAGCGGCDVSLLGIHEKLLDVLESVELVFWPCAMDIKYEDVKKMKDKSIDIVLFNGGIRTEENEEMAKLLRKKAKILVAYGSCASEGCVIGLANLSKREEIFDTVYLKNETTTNEEGIIPKQKTKVNGEELELPEFLPYLKTLDQVVPVDCVIPGCPPPANVVETALVALVKGEFPKEFGLEKAVCDECPREKPEKIHIEKFFRVHEFIADPKKCFLEQGIICMGPATRGGCGAECPIGNFPCTGCMGPPPKVEDQGASMISAISSLLDEEMSEEEEQEMLKKIDDVVGTFYKYRTAKLLPKGRVEDED